MTEQPITICDPQMTDAWSKIISFIRQPSLLRACSKGMKKCWEHAVYLERDLPCCYAEPMHISSSLSAGGAEHRDEDTSRGGGAFPLTLKLGLSRLKEPCTVYVSLPKATTMNETGHLGTGVKRVFLANLPKLKTLEDSVLGQKENDTLEEVHVTDLPELESIGEGFLYKSVALRSVTFQRLPQLSKVGNAWVSDCHHLTKLEIVNLPSLKTIGAYWAADCSKLQEAIFKDLPELQKVGGSWLKHCAKLEKVQFINLPKLAEVGNGWLEQCEALDTVLLRGLINLSAGKMVASSKHRKPIKEIVEIEGEASPYILSGKLF